MDKELELILEELIKDFKNMKEVAAISFAGSSTSKRNDSLSDIDIDIFTYSDISVELREKIISKYAEYKEVGNDYWGQGDEFILKNKNIPIDIAYFGISWIEDIVNNILANYNASVGYSTCFWYNIKNSDIIFDREGRFAKLKEISNCKYPVKLKKNIIEKNYPLLKNNISSYYNQISKAISRSDINSINHRLAGFMASYFDIIFAINEIPHPGEKRLINIIKNTCTKIPKNFEEDINNILKSAGNLDNELLVKLDSLIDNLDDVI